MRPRSSLCALEALSKQTRQSTFSGLAVDVGHIVRQSLVLDRDCKAGSSPVACRLLSFLETVGLLCPSDHLEDHCGHHCGHQTQCLLLVVQALVEHRRPSRVRYWRIVRVNQVASGFASLGAGSLVGELVLLHSRYELVHASAVLVLVPVPTETDGCLSSHLCDEHCSLSE
jgi:hypothetical protein